MTKSTITRERVVALIAEHSYDSALVDALEHLLAAMDSDPVAVCIVEDGKMCPYGFGECDHSLPDGTHELFAAPQLAPERDKVRSEHAWSVRDPFRFVRQAHAEWSDRQFGNVGPVGPLKHLAKEAVEAAEAPDDISEFADILMLLWDATRRAGFSDEQLAEAVAEKLERNKRRQWGAVKDGEPCHHLKN